MSIAFLAFCAVATVSTFVFLGLVSKWKNQQRIEVERIRRQGADNSLGTTELKQLIQDAMQETIAPLEERMDTIEAHVRLLPEGNESRPLELPDPDEYDEASESGDRQRMR